MAREDDVAILGDFSTAPLANVEHLVASGSADVIEGSVTDARLVDRLMAECDLWMIWASQIVARTSRS